ncbi:MAG: polysaccharide biosynthesis tyrosine autokinase [Myxococcales bacterium]|nr:MAG: polysaccharide biosynthesis tyrosine autokinase [Myxococcales bacterium]
MDSFESTMRFKDDEAIDAWKLFQRLFAQKWTIIGVALAVSTAVTLWTLKQPKIYQGTCVIEYDPNPPRPLGSEIEDVANPAVSFWQTQEWYSTQNKIIESRAISENVVKELGLDKNAKFNNVPQPKRSSFKGVSVDEAAQKLQTRLEVEQVAETRLVEVRVEDQDPKRAALLANTVANAYIDKTMQDRMGSTISALEWLSKQLDKQKQELEEAENALHDFKRTNDVLSLSLEDRQNIVANDIEKFSEALAETRTKRIELAAHLSQLKAAYNEDPLEVDIASFTEHPVISELRNSYREKQSEKDSLAVRYGISHPKMKSLDEELLSIRKQMQHEIKGLIRSVESQLREVQQTETGLRVAAKETHEAGLQLNKQGIQYNALKRQEENQSKLYSILLERTTQTDLTRMLHVTHVRVVDRALPPKSAVKPRLLLNIAIGVLLGLLLGFGAALLLVRLDSTLRSPEDVENLGATLLGVLPKINEGKDKAPNVSDGKLREAGPDSPNRDIIVHADPMSAAAECVRTIRTNLTFMATDNPFHTLAVTSSGPLEGKTTVATNLAIALAQTGKKVLLVDTDLRRPRIHKSFKVTAELGVTSVLVREVPLKAAIQSTQIPNLELLPCGPIPPNPSELLGAGEFAHLLAELRSEYDRVIFDSPPLGAVTDAAVIAPQVDGTIVVVRSNKTGREGARAALRRLRDVEAKVIGVVLNAVDLNNKSHGYGGYYYYNYEYRTSHAPASKNSNAA